MSLPRRRGFAMATAILLIPLAMVAIMSVGMLCAADYRRTANAAAGAQLRQILLAAAIDARAHLDQAGPSASWNTPLPTALASAGAKVQTKMVIDAEGAQVAISAKLENQRAAQDIRFAREHQRWIMISTDLLDAAD